MKKADKQDLLESLKRTSEWLENLRRDIDHPYWREQKIDEAQMEARTQLRKHGVEV